VSEANTPLSKERVPYGPDSEAKEKVSLPPIGSEGLTPKDLNLHPAP